METERRGHHGKTTLIGSAACCSPAACWRHRPALAAEVTPQRLLNPDKEPQNWLMNHRTYDGQRFSPLDADQQGQRQGPQARLCGRRSAAARATNSTRRRRSPRTASSTSPIPGACSTRSTAPRATSAASSGAWSPSRSGRRSIAAPPSGAISSSRPPTRRPASSPPTRPPARSCGRPTSPSTCRRCRSPARRSPIKDKIIVGAAGGDRGIRDWIAALDAATGKVLWRKFTVPAPGEPGSETWKGNDQCLADRRRRLVGDRHLRPRHQPDAVGRRQPGAAVRCEGAAGRQPLHQQRHLLGPRQRQDELVLPVHARRHVGLRRGRHPHHVRTRDRRPAAQARHPFGAQRLRLHDGPPQRRDGRRQGLTRTSTGPRASTRRPASRSTTIPTRTSRPIPGLANPTADAPVKKVCPNRNGGNNYYPSSYSPQDPAALHSRHDGMRIRVHRQGQAEDGKGLDPALGRLLQGRRIATKAT